MILTHLLLCCGRGKSEMHCIYSNLHTKMQLRDRAVAHWNNMQCTHAVQKSLQYQKIIFFTSAAALSFMLMYRFESSRSPTWKTHTAYPPAYFYDRTGTMSHRQSTSINVRILIVPLHTDTLTLTCQVLSLTKGQMKAWVEMFLGEKGF